MNSQEETKAGLPIEFEELRIWLRADYSSLYGSGVVTPFWNGVSDHIEKRDLQFPDINDSPKFHLRWASGSDPERCWEVFRIRGDEKVKKEVQSFAKGLNGVERVEWKPISFSQSFYPKPFFTFIQACTILWMQDPNGIADRIHIAEEKHVIRANDCLRDDTKSHYKKLKPWLDLYEFSKNDNETGWHLAHWFGHIFTSDRLN